MRRIDGAAHRRRTVDPATGWAAVASRCARGVVLVGTGHGGDIHVMTACTFGVVSMDPPMVLVILGARGRTRRMLGRSGMFGVCLLGGDHEAAAARFTVAGPTRWTDLAPDRWWRAPMSGAPLLQSAVGWLDCAVDRVVDVADRAVAIGRVLAVGTGSTASPLIRFDGAYHRLGPAGQTRRAPDSSSEGRG